MPPPKPRGLIYFLTLLPLLAISSMHVLARRNGTFDYRETFVGPRATLPNSSIPFQTPKLGLPKLEGYLALMLSIFWVDLDPRNVVAHVQGTHFLGTLSGAWMIMMVETHRMEMGHWFVAKTYLVEILAELAGLGVFTPIWCAMQLRNRASLGLKGARRFRARDALTLPVALVVGHFVPTLAMIWCQPDGEGWRSQQMWVLLRLIHPVFTYAIWIVLRLFVPDGDRPVSPTGWYASIIIVGTVFHTISLGPIAMTHLAAGWLNPVVVQQLDYWSIFVPSPFWTSAQKVKTFAQGVSFFLQWDEIFTAIAMFSWASYHYAQSGGMQNKITSLTYLSILLMLGGPLVAAAYMMQESDKLDEEKSIVESGKKSQ